MTSEKHPLVDLRGGRHLSEIELGDIFFSWQISDTMGWGVYGLNLVLHGPPDRRPIPFKHWPPSLLHPLDPFSAKIIEDVGARHGFKAKPGDYVLTSIVQPSEYHPQAGGVLNVGVTFFETTPFPPKELDAHKKYAAIIAGSTWNRDYLAANGVDTRLVIQGVNTDLFRVQKKRHFKHRFVVFSGGKLEPRKGQDIALKAFSIFAQRHPDALLVTTWRSNWERQYAPQLNVSGVCKPMIPDADMGKAIRNWVYENGVRPSQYFPIEMVPNFMMPEVLREADLAVFTNRAEGGTNLVAMEALACGVPTLLSNNTGHKDIIRSDNCIPLKEQGQVQFMRAVSGDWGESSVDEVIAGMEDAYAGRHGLDRHVISRSMADHSWEAAITNLVAELERIGQ